LLKEADVIVFYLLENYCQINLIFGIWIFIDFFCFLNPFKLFKIF
jgi:hypothetical protein